MICSLFDPRLPNFKRFHQVVTTLLTFEIDSGRQQLYKAVKRYARDVRQLRGYCTTVLSTDELA